MVALLWRRRSGGGEVASAANNPRGKGGTGSAWRYLPLILALAGAGFVYASGAHRYLGMDALIEHRDRLQAFVAAHHAKALVVYMVVYVVLVTLSVPGAVFLTILGGFLFGWLVGGAAAAVSATMGAAGVFLIARTSIGDALLRRAGERVRRVAAGFRSDAFSYLLFLRFLPIVPFWITNLAAALFGVPLRTFFLATQIGVIPGTFAFAVAGSGLDSIIAAQHAARDACLAAGGSPCALHLSPKHLITPHIMVAFVALGILALAPVIVRRFYGRRLKALDQERTGS
jgi:uncharacterized membrane protein YdjX (TVP38/TMEM64 family)